MHIKKIMLEGEKGRHERVNTVLFYLYQCIKQKKSIIIEVRKELPLIRRRVAGKKHKGLSI